MDGLTIAHLGDIGHTLSDEQLESLEGVDILILPVGGDYTLDAKKAVEVVSQIEPRIVIPMHYKIKGLNLPLDEVDKFNKELGISPVIEEKLKISRKDLPQEGMELFVLNPSN
jgi:L-ascorbate metabolism protein UlaG (beta-lactamase superfamily)